VVITPVRNNDGRLIGFSKVTRDMTDRRRLEEKLRRSNEELDQRVQERTTQLEQAVRARDEFMSIISHELRTPLTSLKLQVQMAERMVGRNHSAEFLERTEKFVMGAGRQLDRLARLIDDMLDVSRISIDRLSMTKSAIDFSDLVRENVERFDLECKKAGCMLELECERSLVVSGDRQRLDQVISNLLSNAKKYGQAKPISVRVHKAGSQVLLDVRDQGIGISTEDHDRIFERFERAVSANEVSGMGLGLYISKKIIEAHQGKISVTSEIGKGSIFTISLPALS
jgi:signal transduction histidine kinase